MPQVNIVSFGYLHAPAPEAHLTLDLRRHYRDPHVRPELRQLTALDAAVRDAVLATPGIPALLDAVEAAIEAYLAGPTPAALAVAIGCAGGRHRSAVVAAELAARVERRGTPVTLTHRDLHLPVINR